jgi:hypothetical protein
MRIGQVANEVVMRFVAIAIILIPVTYFSGYDIVKSVSSIFETRVETRLDSDGMFTYAESSIVKFWEDQPYFAITGVGLGGSTFYVREYDTASYFGYIAAPRGIIGFVSDRGIVGLLLFLSALIKASRPLFAVAASKSPNRQVYRGILVICSVSTVMMFTAGQWHDEWLTVGLICAGAALANREMHMMRTASAFSQMSSSERYLMR